MRWRLAIDTGGTFTDCLATPPTGATRRVKVLSSSSIRARVAARPDRHTLITRWHVAPDVLAGCTLCGLDGASWSDVATSIAGHADGPGGVGVVTLHDPLPNGVLPPGAPFEVRTPWQPPILAARIATRTPASLPLPAIDMRLATTRGTNALLERRGHEPALFITAGFSDLLEIGDQSRPDLFALDISRPPALHAGAYEVVGRLAADGSVLHGLDESALVASARAALAAGHTTAAVALLHAWANPAHERAVADILRGAGFEHVSTSADLSPLIGFLARAQSAVVNAYLSRIIGEYLGGVERGLGPDGRLLVMTSAGGLSRASEFRPKDSLLSGPAGGLLGAADAAAAAGVAEPWNAGASPRPAPLGGGGFDRVLTFDMGGTSTDVARCDSASRRAFPLVREHRVGDARVLAPAVAVESVAAGGGSVCSFDRGELRVGPESAGAIPGPACYGAGGPLTLTDCHVLLGRVDVGSFAIPVDVQAAERAAGAVLERVNAGAAVPLSTEALLEGFLALADERMAEAIRSISIRQGHDPADFALLAFGGAGGLHACGLAERLGVSRVLVPEDAGLLSARGLGAAAIERSVQRQALRPLGRDAGWLGDALRTMERAAVEAVASDGVDPAVIRVTRRQVAARVAGHSASLDVSAEAPERVAALFSDAYERTFGHRPPDREVEIESMLVVAAGPAGPAPIAGNPASQHRGPDRGQENQAAEPLAAAPRNQRVFAGGRWHDAAVVRRQDVGDGLSGPAVIAEAHSTAFVPPGWAARRVGAGAIAMFRQGAASGDGEPDRLVAAGGLAPEAPVALELFIASLTAIAGDMGQMLRRTALSVNVKERLDFSCAIMAPDGRLLVNAPHIPVHLGALGLCVRALARAIDMRPGDTVITNHPAYGGSHLPDVTLVTPVFLPMPAGPRLIGYAASRAHHAEIGGIVPGSMPPGATRLAEEGVVIPPMHLVRAGEQRFAELARLLSTGPYPTRALEHNLADVRAALAANLHGAGALVGLFARTGPEAAAAHCDALTARARSRVREALSRIAPGVYRSADALDDGSRIAVEISISGATPGPGGPGAQPRPVATIDFAGSASIHPQNFNATPAIATAAVLYVLRLLAREAIPLNEGMLEAIDLRLPERTILNPGDAWTDSDGPGVAAGNVETSQRIVDVLLLALGLAAASQGTMNNLAFGNDNFGFYETICGGAGATPAAPGASGVHTHMTNTRITDVEILEQRLPVRVRRFQIRRGSGGRGFHRGGDGVVREIEFLTPVVASVLAQRRTSGPPGLNGGEPGLPGAHYVSRFGLDGAGSGKFGPEEARLSLDAGDVLTLETPGGGGWGNP
jgi:5-oxoprolinase (ATP-hydrolysing)